MIEALLGLFGVELDLGSLVFLACVLVGGIGLLLTVVLDGVLDVLNLDFGGESLAPFATAFVSLFGLGGLFAQGLGNLPSGPAALVGVATGSAGGAAMIGAMRLLRRSEDAGAPERSELVGRVGEAAEDLAPGRIGEIVLTVGGMPTRFRASAQAPIARGTAVVVREEIGGRLVVEARTEG